MKSNQEKGLINL